MIRWLSLFAILLWCVGDPIRDYFWGHPVFHPGVRWDWWHICKAIHTYPPLACLLWWMWPICGWRTTTRVRPYIINFDEDKNGETVAEYYDKDDERPSSSPYI